MVHSLKKKKFFIITTVPVSLNFFSGQTQVLKREFDVEVVSGSGIKMDSFCKKEEVKGHVIEMKREISFFSDLKSLLQLVFLFLRERPDIIHGSTPKAGLLSMISGWMTRVPARIYYIHGLRYQGATGIKKKILITMEKLSCFFATDIFSVSTGVKEVLGTDQITVKKINIIGNGSVNGIDIDYFSVKNPDIVDIRDHYNIGKDDFIFGFVGRIVKDKGIHELVHSFLKINKTFVETKLLLVGNYEDLLSPLDKAVKMEIEHNKNIINTGFQHDIRPFLKIMDIFVFPSYREGFGVSLMEAAAMEVPIIATDIIGCNEVIKEGYNGVLVPPKSTEVLMKTMEMLLLNKKKLEDISHVTREFVIDKYEQKELWEKTLEAYCKVVDSR